MRWSWAKLLLAVSVCFPGAAEAFWDPITEACQPPVMAGIGEAVDGNTLVLKTVGGAHLVVRLHAIDAPDPGQTCRADGQSWNCGQAASRALGDLVNGRELQCLACGYDPTGRTLALCRDGETDIGVAMVRSGMAVGRAFFSNALHASQVRAEMEGIGMWRGDFVDPLAWRQGRRLGAAPCRGCANP
jgi:endonuclease YncB( thermonuclease family)